MKLFPKLFIADAAISFRRQLKNRGYNYPIHELYSREDLLHFIEVFSSYKNYTLPVIITDVSFFNKKDQSLLLKFMDDTNLNLILLASRDNILNTIISRVKEFRKFYISKPNSIGFLYPSKAREASLNDLKDVFDISSDDRMSIYNKYNPILTYDDYLVRSFSKADKERVLSLLEA